MDKSPFLLSSSIEHHVSHAIQARFSICLPSEIDSPAGIMTNFKPDPMFVWLLFDAFRLTVLLREKAEAP